MTTSSAPTYGMSNTGVGSTVGNLGKKVSSWFTGLFAPSGTVQAGGRRRRAGKKGGRSTRRSRKH